MPMTRIIRTIAVVALFATPIYTVCAAEESMYVRSDRSYYLPMRDGVRLAVSLYFPGGQEPKTRAPTILVQTRYGRAFIFTHGDVDKFYHKLRDAGYVIAIVDTRGSTASFGPREVDIGPDEVRDMDEIIAHLAAASWSDGSVFATGVSYMATTSDVATSRPSPALKGAIVRHPDFDPYISFQRPGGVTGLLMDVWGNGTLGMDLGRRVIDSRELDCQARVADCAGLWPTLQPVDGDEDFKLLRQALAGRNRWTMKTYEAVEFRDDKGTNGYHLFAITGGSQIEGIRRQAVPVQFWSSWYDADTAAGALARFRSTPNVPAEIWITSNNHPNMRGADPFFSDKREPRPPIAEQQTMMMDFLRRLRENKKPERLIHYYVLGTERFRDTPVWPPAGVKSQFLAFGPHRTLVVGKPGDAVTDRYEVDFNATTGKQSRWFLMPNYQDRAQEDRKLLVYDGTPLDSDMELAGTPVATLHMTSLTHDPALHVYLEDLAPDGRVTYLTEGVFRAINRKPAERSAVPYDEGPAPHTYLRPDARPMQPGMVATVEFALFPIAAKISKGHRLRVAIAGADHDNFRRYSEGKAEAFQIHSTDARPSGVAIPLRPWTTP